jgi:beta-galactosidase
MEMNAVVKNRHKPQSGVIMRYWWYVMNLTARFLRCKPRRVTVLLGAFMWTAVVPPAGAVEPARVVIRLDTGWLYNRTDNAGYSAKEVNEGSFSKVCLPHANVITRHMYQSENAYWFASWYRRHFTPPTSWKGKRFLIEFQAVSTVATVYVNGTAAGEHYGGYTPFTLDITDRLLPGQDNVIAVRADARFQAEVPPEGGNLDFMIYGGIVRHVNLFVTDPLHVERVFTCTDNPSQSLYGSPTITTAVEITNNGTTTQTCDVSTTIFNSDNELVATAASPTREIAANRSVIVEQETSPVVGAQLWDTDHPNLYHCVTQLIVGGTIVDEYTTRFGIRSLTMNKTDGKVYLNGKALKLRGLNRHETYPYIGRAASRRLQRMDADILKYELGCNIVRTSHYPQAPDFLDRCDEIGLLVLEEVPGWMYIGNETWKTRELQVLKDMILRDRNHPSVMTWGVRVNESPDDNAFYKRMNDTAHAYDPTRLTCGVRRSNSDPATSFLEDIWTQNFLGPSTSPPNMPVITSEYCGHNLDPQAHAWDTDEILVNQITDAKFGHAKGHEASYATANWGGLLGWCAFDYASGHPNATTKETGRGLNGYVSHHGVSSIFRLPKLAGWFYQSQRDPALYGPMVHICNYWTAGSPSTVLVVSNCEEVEFFKDGTSLGKKSAGNLYTHLPHPLFSWNITFTPGAISAVGYIGGNQAAEHTVHTPGAPAALTVVPDTNVLYIGGDMTRVIVSLNDVNGQLLHLRADSVVLSANGAGDFIGEERTALEGGQMAFFVKTRASETGMVTCQASAGGISGTATISVVQEPAVSVMAPQVLRKPQSTIRTLHSCTVGDRLLLPHEAMSAGTKVLLYDLSGRLVCTAVPKTRILDLKKYHRVEGVMLVKIDRR